MQNIEIESYDLNSAMDSKRLGYLIFGSEQLGQLIFGSEPVTGSSYLLRAYNHFQKFFSNFYEFLKIHPQILKNLKISTLVGHSLNNRFQLIKDKDPMINTLFNVVMLIKILKSLMPQDQMGQNADSKAHHKCLDIVKIEEETNQLQDRIRSIQEFNNTAEEFSQLKNRLDEIMTELGNVNNHDSELADQFSQAAYAFTQSAHDIHQQAQCFNQKLSVHENVVKQSQLEPEDLREVPIRKSGWTSCIIL